MLAQPLSVSARCLCCNLGGEKKVPSLTDPVEGSMTLYSYSYVCNMCADTFSMQCDCGPCGEKSISFSCYQPFFICQTVPTYDKTQSCTLPDWQLCGASWIRTALLQEQAKWRGTVSCQN
jgi:hypothetical protein